MTVPVREQSAPPVQQDGWRRHSQSLPGARGAWPWQFWRRLQGNRASDGRDSSNQARKSHDKEPASSIVLTLENCLNAETQIQIDLESSEDDIQEIQQEISVLSTCASPFVTQYKASFLRGHKLWIVMEYLGGGSCLDLVSIELCSTLQLTTY